MTPGIVQNQSQFHRAVIIQAPAGNPLISFRMPDQRFAKSNLPLHLLLGAIVLACATLEAWFGRAELFGDDISYLDVTNLIRLGDWKAALSPLWSIGYPLLLAATRSLFPSGIRGELTAVFALNLVICAATWLAFLWFLQTAAAFLAARESLNPTPLSPFVLIAAACVFVVVELSLGRVSSVGPDQLVTCLFFAASALLLRFSTQPSIPNGLRLGAVLGLGFIVKAIFLPLAVIVVATALLPFRRRLPRRAALSISAAFLLLAIPYAAAISWAVGRTTIGESGPLNYAFHVNQLPHWMGWQGGQPPLGTPIHPIHLLRDQPAVFGFAEPFHVTYPPQYNLFYWYDGYNHFFSPLNALRAIVANLHALEAVLHENAPFTVGLLLAIAILAYRSRVPHRASIATRVGFAASAWPLFLPSLLALLLYIQVHLEARYVSAFLAILAMIPFLAARRLSYPTRAVVVAILLLGTVADLYPILRLPARRALAHTDMQSEGQWIVAHFLTQSGLKPGDKVASVTTLNDIRCTWAYAAGLHVVADIGNDAFDPQLQHEDFNRFWTDPATQQDVLRLFREQGAVAVIAPSVSPRALPLTPAWQHIPDTNAWILRL